MTEPRRAGAMLPAHLSAALPTVPVSTGPASEPAGLGVVVRHTAPTEPGEPMFACPCPCQCGNATTMPVRKVSTSAALQRLLRCPDCAALGGVHAAGAPPRPASPVTAAVPAVSALDAELDAAAATEWKGMLKAEQLARWRASVPEKFRGARLDERVDKGNAEAIKTRLRLLRDHGQYTGALLHGGLGGGKTWLGYAYANLAIENDLLKQGEVKHGREVSLLGDIAVATWSERSALIKSLMSPRIKMLLIDDVGREAFMRPADRRALYDQITDLAWANGRILVITTNLRTGSVPVGADGTPAPDAVADQYLWGWLGNAASSRVSAACGDGPIIVPDRNMRRTLAAEQRGARPAAPSATGRSH